MSKEMISVRFSVYRFLKRSRASSVSFASISSVIWMADVFLFMIAVILNVMEVLEVGVWKSGWGWCRIERRPGS